MKLRIVGSFFVFLTQIAVVAEALAQTPGVVNDTVVCKKASSQTYALYLPSAYSPSTSYGLILLFDPGARGKMPVELYQKLADKYSVILACSNNSHNGPIDESLRAGNAVLEDVLSRFNVNKQFIIASGFSGGGRTAVDFAKNKSLLGVIACGAAFASQSPITKEKPIPFAEVIGQVDMNYQESLRASSYLKSISNPSLLIFFYGGHQWPPVEAYEEALAWHNLRANNNKMLSDRVFSTTMKRVKIQIDSGYLFEANRMLDQLKVNFTDASKARSIDSTLLVVMKNKKLNSDVRDAVKTDDKEQRLQAQFYQVYNQHMAYAAPDSAYHPQYWKGYRKECDKMVESGGYKKLAGLRLIDYGWRICAEQHYVFLEYGQYRQSAMCARIWSLVQPERAGPCVQAAKAFALLGKKGEMTEYLKMAMLRGVKDKNAVMNDPAFKSYSSTPDFRNIFK
jgi:predicted esterase